MKKFQKVFLGMLAAGAVLFTSCGGDGEDEEPVGPSLNYIGASSVDTTIAPGESFTFSITATKGDVDMDEITFREGGNPLSSARFTVEGYTSEDGGVSLSGGDKNDFDKDITLVAGDESSTIAIAVIDKDGETAGLSVSITVEEPVTSTPLVETTGHMIYNADGSNSGSFDLSAADNVTSASADGDIQDQGLNADVSAWEQKIAPENGAAMISITAAEYADLDEETVASVFTAGTEITLSDELAVDSAFLFSVDGTYYAIKVTAVDVTASDNNDSFTFSLKTIAQ